MKILSAFPSLGFFGDADGLSLHIPMKGRSVTAVRLSLDHGKAEFLNLKGIRMLSAGKSIMLDKVDIVCSQSSFHKSDKVRDPSSLVFGDGVHSDYEVDPWWRIDFSSPRTLDSLEVMNRPDRWGCRSRFLRVDVLLEGGNWECLHFGGDGRRIIEAIENLLAIGVPQSLLNELYQGHRENVLGILAVGIKENLIDINKIDFRLILQLCDAWGWERISDHEMTVVAAMLLVQALNDRNMAIMCVSGCLPGKNDIARLTREINAISSRRGLGDWVVTRHGVQRSRLISEKASFLLAAKRVCDELSSMHLSPILGYGTLLGAVRDKSFIPHDDDLDLIYLIPSRDRDEALKCVLDVKKELERNGFECGLMMPHGLNLHVKDRESGAVIDIFPCWNNNGRLFLHMEKMVIRDIAADIVFPPAVVELYGESFSAPADAGAFLEERYGSGWMKSDPFFEWPWTLEG
ncbi:hypothetical protein D9M68_161340 [compost metagenome]